MDDIDAKLAALIAQPAAPQNDIDAKLAALGAPQSWDERAGNFARSAATEFLPAAAEGFAGVGRYPNPLPGSVMTEPTTEFGKMGKKVGNTSRDLLLMYLASKGAEGAAPEGDMLTSPSTRPLGTAMAHGARTGMLYAAEKGAVDNAPVADTVKDMGKNAAGFSVIGGAGQLVGRAAGAVRNWVGNDLASQDVNYFLGTPQKMAEKLQEQRQPSLGAQVLSDEPALKGFKTRDEVRRAALSELEKEQEYTAHRLQQYQDEARTPNDPQVSNPEYRGAVPTPSGFVTEKVPPQITHNPAGGRTVEPGGGAVPTIPNWYLHGPQGEGVLLDPKVTTSPGSKYDTFIPRSGTYADNTAVTPEPTNPPSNAKEMWKSVSMDKIPSNPYPKKGPVIGLADLVNETISPVMDEYKRKGNPAAASQVAKWADNFVNANGGITDLLESNNARKLLDDEVGKAYLSGGDAKLSPKIEAQMNVANALRSKLSDMAPEVADSLERQHRMLNVATSLSPLTAGSGKVPPIGVFKTGVNMFAGSRENYGMAQVMNSVLGKPSTVVAPAVGAATKFGLAEMLQSTGTRKNQ